MTEEGDGHVVKPEEKYMKGDKIDPKHYVGSEKGAGADDERHRRQQEKTDQAREKFSDIPAPSMPGDEGK